MKERPAFTIVEMLLSITLMAVLTAAVTIDFGSLSRRAKLNTVRMRLEATIQQARLSVQSGAALEGQPLCVGLQLSSDVLSQVEFHWDTPTGTCDLSTVLVANSLMVSPLTLSTLQVGGLPIDTVYLLFTPPLATRHILDSSGQDLSGTVDFSIVYPDTELHQDLSL